MGLLDFFRKKKISLADSGILKGMSDCHSHILPGVDDGVSDIQKSIEILAYMESVGISQVWCTPHIMDDYPNQTDVLQAKFAQLRDTYDGSLKLNLAAEYMLDNEFEQRLAAGDLLTMSDDIVLVETSSNVPPYNFHEMLGNMMSKGYRPMLAHPERYRYLDMDGYRRLREMGVRFQLNLGSTVAYYGETAQKKSWKLLSEGCYDAAGSDCHRYSSIYNQYNRAELPDEVIACLSRLVKTSVQ